MLAKSRFGRLIYIDLPLLAHSDCDNEPRGMFGGDRVDGEKVEVKESASTSPIWYSPSA